MTYVIAEIGQNHQGSVTLAEALVDMAADPRPADLREEPHYHCDAVKTTIRDLKQECATEQWGAVYDSPNSFGRTYGEHRAALELNLWEQQRCHEYAHERGLQHGVTICGPRMVEPVLRMFSPDFLKVASRDLRNIPLLEVLAETRVPMFVSTGMAAEEDVCEAMEAITRYHDDVGIFHCLSTYPAPPEHVNLLSIQRLMELYPDQDIGYSDHTIGTDVAVAAVAFGARHVEKHVTLDRTMRGSDHAGSLERDGLWRLLRGIRNIDRAKGKYGIWRHESVEESALKLERSLAAGADIPEGGTIAEGDLVMLSPGTGYRWRDRARVVGKRAEKYIPKYTIIHPDHVTE